MRSSIVRGFLLVSLSTISSASLASCSDSASPPTSNGDVGVLDGGVARSDAGSPPRVDGGAACCADASDAGRLPDGALPSGDLDAARAFVDALLLGVNIERGWAWDATGVNAQTSTTYFTYLRSVVGVTHVRLFYPWRPSVTMGGGSADNAPPDEAQFARILDASAQAMKAGLRVFVDCTDVMGIEDFTGANGAATEAHIASCAKWTASRHFDPTMFALGPVNEWAGENDNTAFNAYRKHFHGVLRAALPGYVLTTGPAYWKSRDFLYDETKKFETMDDLRVVYEWHEYSSLDANGWKAEEAKLAAWRAAHGGRPTICGEAGAGYWDEPSGGTTLGNDPAAWPARFAEMLGNISKERPSIWAVTYGSAYRVNKSGSDPHIMDGTGGQPDLLKMFQDGVAAIAAAH